MKAHSNTLFRKAGSTSDTWSLPKSKSESWGPFALDDTKVLILSDIHLPFHDEKALLAAVKEGKRRKVNCIFLNGDINDFYSSSKFDKHPTKSKLIDEIKMCREFLGWLRQEFPKARIIFKKGNHDEWFDKYLWRKAPELVGLRQVTLEHLVAGKLENEKEVKGVEFLEDQAKVQAGHLMILHGHELARQTIAIPVSAARKARMATGVCTLIGHYHKTSQDNFTNADGTLVSAWSTGCLCGLWPDYAKVNNWNHGFAFLHQGKSGFDLENLRVVHGKVRV